MLDWLPEKLPDTADPVWTTRLSNTGHGGVAVADGVCVTGTRDLADEEDVFDAMDAQTGERLWRHSYSAPGSLDYGNSPRATPVIRDGTVYLLGALGHLSALDLATGDLKWEKNLTEEYEIPQLEWGLAGTPLLVGNTLIVQPGGRKACVAGLDSETGEELWKTPRGKPSHSSFLSMKPGKEDWAVGFDANDLLAISVKSGQELWRVQPELSGDFNVPSPVRVGDWLLFVATENNGARLFELDDDTARTGPQAHNEDFTPDSHTPVAVGNRIYGVHHGLWAFDAHAGPRLSVAWKHPDPQFNEYAFLAASGRKILVLTYHCQLILYEDQGETVRELDRLDLKTETTETLSAPAFVGTRCYIRIGKEIKCLELSH